MTTEELTSFAHERMTYFKVPKFIKFVDNYPLTVTGKIRKVQLREMALEDFDLNL